VQSFARAINPAGTIVGWEVKDIGGVLRSRAVRWDASGTATELGDLGAGFTGSYATAVNAAGVAVGVGEKFSVAYDQRPVRWDASGRATELGNLGTLPIYGTECYPYAINDAGTAVGYAGKFYGGLLARRAVRWEASGSAAIELRPLGSGQTYSEAVAINTAGTAVGYEAFSAGYPPRAVRWDASGTAATELGNLGIDSGDGLPRSGASAINDAGAAVGFAVKYTAGGTLIGSRAVVWNSDAIPIDLNTLIDPASGWTLTNALAISITNWVAGVGDFDPDGAGPLDAYPRAFLLDVSSVVPEPDSLSLLAVVGLALLRRRRVYEV
jgi:uncharacterized membrane protein